MTNDIRVRYAPSPTGPQHIGGIRTALYNYLFAKKLGGKIILRIEDTDQKRFVEGAEDYIIKSVDWCGFKFDEGPHIEPTDGENYGPYRQSERKHIYLRYAQQLIDSGDAYYAFDTPEELEEVRKNAEKNNFNWKYDGYTRTDMKNSLTLNKEDVEQLLAKNTPYTIRFKMPVEENIVINDMVRKEVIFNSSELDDKIIFKSDGLPTYHLANVVDDHLMKITHVIRGEEWLPSSPLHVMLYKKLGWENTTPIFAHLPLLLKPNGKGKLSKRDGDAAGFPVFPLDYVDSASGEKYSGYKESGYFSDAFLNIIAFLGWNPGTEKEIYNMDELIQDFSLERVIKSGAKFDPDKARWYNQQFLWKKTEEELAELLSEELSKKELSSFNLDLIAIAKNMKERVQFVHEIPTNAPYFFEKPQSFDEKTIQKKWKESSLQIVKELTSVFEDVTEFKATELENKFKSYVEEKELGFGVAMIALRLCLTGQGGGPNLFEIADILGKEETISRLNEFSLKIENLKLSAAK